MNAAGQREYVHRHVVPFEETNLVGNVYFAHYVRWQGHCREAFLADQAPEVMRALHGGDLALITVSTAVEYIAECFALDVVDVAMRLAAASANRIEMSFDYRRDGQTIAVGQQVVACMARLDGHMVPAPLPEALRSALSRYR